MLWNYGDSEVQFADLSNFESKWKDLVINSLLQTHHVYAVAPPTGNRKQALYGHVDDRIDFYQE